MVPPVPASPPPPSPPTGDQTTLSPAEKLAEDTPGLDVAQRFALQTIAKHIPRALGRHSQERQQKLLDQAKREVAAKVQQDPGAVLTAHPPAPAPATSAWGAKSFL